MCYMYWQSLMHPYQINKDNSKVENKSGGKEVFSYVCSAHLNFYRELYFNLEIKSWAW